MPRRFPARTVLQLGGPVFLALLLAPRLLHPAPDGQGPGPATLLLGSLPLVSFLWLVLAGFFGYGSARRSDWPAIPPFLLALLVREFLTLHSIAEIEIQFAVGHVTRHSVAYPLIQLYFGAIVTDLHAFVLHMNGIVGSLATLPLYLFVRQRTGSRTAGFLAAFFFAAHPVIARVAPTDLPYSLLLATWFSGLALLSDPGAGSRSIIGAGGLLGIAATCRMEGVLYLGAALLVLDHGQLISAVRRRPWAFAVSCAAVAGLWALQMRFLYSLHMGGPSGWRDIIPGPRTLLDDTFLLPEGGNELFTCLLGAGIAAGVACRRWRVGLWAFLAVVLVLAPFTRANILIISSHRLVPSCALQALVAGIGVAWLASLLDRFRTAEIAAVSAGAFASLFMLYGHRADLTERFVFNEEYEMVRSHLGPGNADTRGCTLVTFNMISSQDIDIHDFRQVVPDVRTLDCLNSDCRRSRALEGCVYYVRSAICYYHPAGISAECWNSGADRTGDRLACMNDPCASFERAYELSPVDLRTINIQRTFPDRSGWENTPQQYRTYPAAAQAGLFKVIGPRR